MSVTIGSSAFGKAWARRIAAVGQALGPGRRDVVLGPASR